MLISTIIPVLNEAKNLKQFIEETDRYLNNPEYAYEYIFVDDGSEDNSADIIKQLTSTHPIKLIKLSRNFGKENAIYAGLSSTKADAAIIIDADLQHPPSLIPQFIKHWEQGSEMVYGILEDRQHQGRIKRFFSDRYYRLINKLTSITIPRNAGDFRLVSRRAINAILSCKEKNLFMKGLYAWIGLPSQGIPYKARIRHAGTTKWSPFKLLSLAIEGITSFSNVPLRMATVVGITISSLSFCYAIYIIISALLFGIKTPGFPSLIVTILFLGGLQLIAVGIVGEYIAKIYTEVKSRPHYILNTLEHKGEVILNGSVDTQQGPPDNSKKSEVFQKTHDNT
jgi:polyisoprenyl-phosphate glycosyltransferase